MHYLCNPLFLCLCNVNTDSFSVIYKQSLFKDFEANIQVLVNEILQKSKLSRKAIQKNNRYNYLVVKMDFEDH